MAGARAWTELSLPPPPGVPALRSPSLRQARSARTAPVDPEQAATASSAGRRTGGSARHHCCGPPSRGRSEAGEAAGAGGWSQRLGKCAAPRLRGGCAAPRCSAARPRPPPAAWVLCCSVSEFAGVSTPCSRRRRAARRGVGSLQRSVSLPPCGGASRVPLRLGEGGVRGWGGHAGLADLKAFRLRSPSPEWGGRRGQL